MQTALNEIYALLAALEDEPAHTACLTAALSRLSQCESVALKWVDIVDGEIRVRHRTSLNLLVLTRKSRRQTYATRTLPRGMFISKLG